MRKLLLPLGLLLTCGLAQAADNGFYLGAGVTQAKLNNVGKDFDAGDLNDFKIDNTAWKVIAGFRPVDFFAVEANYQDLGDERRSLGGGEFRAKAKAYSAYAVGFLPIPVIDLYGKAGLSRWDATSHFTGLGGFDLDDSGTEFAWGVGAQAHLGSLAARLEYEKFDVAHTDGVELLTLGLTWTFL